MFACLYLPPPAKTSPPQVHGTGLKARDLIQLARDFSPRVETYGERLVTLDISGLGSLLGDARAIGEELRRSAADRGLRVHIAIAATTAAAILLAHSRAGLVVIPAGDEARALASLPLSALQSLNVEERGSAGARERGSAGAKERKSEGPEGRSQHAPSLSRSHAPSHASAFHRWGLRTLGDLAAMPAADLSERLGQDGLVWQRWARGEDARPLVPAGPDEAFEAALDLEWPVEGLEPLSFVLARLFDPLCERLEKADRGAVALHLTLTLVNRQRHERSLQLPAPMRDPRVLRTLALLDLESHPPPAGIDRVSVAVDVTEGHVLQFGLFARALPTERLATLLARLSALMGSTHVGAPALVDSYRPGAFTMTLFDPSADTSLSHPDPPIPAYAVRRFRLPIPARVTLERGRPARLTTDRRGFAGGPVERCDGPWRSSGDWWRERQSGGPWNCDEWDVALGDGSAYRVSQTPTGWFIDGVLD